MNGAHLHLVLNHIPLFALLFGGAILLYGRLRDNDFGVRIALVLFVIAGMAAGGTYLTGEGAEEVVEGQPNVMHSYIESHETVALYALIASVVLGVMALGTLAFYRSRRIPNPLNNTLLLVAVVALGIIAYTANTGGKISHPELRSGADAVHSIEEEHDDD